VDKEVKSYADPGVATARRSAYLWRRGACRLPACAAGMPLARVESRL